MPPSGRIEIVDSTLSGNGSGGGGAAVNNAADGVVTITGSTVSDNPGQMIPDPLDPEGMIPAPGVYEPNSSPIANQGNRDDVGTIRITDSVVSDNYSDPDGGGFANHGDGAVIVEDTAITDNTTEAAGGGIFSNGGTLSVTDSTVSGNEAADGGGIYSVGGSSAIGLRPRITIADSTVSNNVAGASGGGVLNDGDGVMTVTDVTIKDNKAGDAGGGLNNQGRATLTVTRVAFSGNETNNEGGGAWSASERLATITNSTFSDNKGGVPEIDEGVPEPGEPAGEPSLNTAGGGGLYTEGGPVSISDSSFAGNSATEEGGGLSIDNFGDVRISDSVIRDNRAGADGGGVENSGFRVTFERLRISDNRATLDGGGIYNSSSNPFFILDTTVERNSAQDGGGLANAPDNDLIIRGSLFTRNTARHPGISEDGDPEEGGHGGGIVSIADGDALIENTTISGNTAAVGGGGIFHDADGELKLNNLTIWRNSAPQGGGIGVVESDFSPEVPPKANVSIIVKNSIVGGSLRGGSCDWYVTSEGGNIDTGGLQDVLPLGEGPGLPAETKCFLAVAANSDSTASPRRDRYNERFTLDALADNGGPTLTHRLNWGSLAIDAAVTPCPETDQRGVERPQNGRCDMGAFEFEGDPPPFDDTPPETEYLSGPIQDTPETVQYRFRGTDNQTAAEDLNFECRLLEFDLVEEPEILAPWDPVPPEEQWVGCRSPWQGLLLEEGQFRFEVRAVDRADNTDPTPAVRDIPGDVEPAGDDHRGEAAARQQQPRRHVHLLRYRRDHAAAVPRVRVPPRHRAIRRCGWSA